MTSRTTKQAARAYQKAHDVPYAEALRRVMNAESASPEPSAHEVDPATLIAGRSTASSGEELVFNLGDGLLPDTGFTQNSVPALWAPGEAMRDGRAATLGVYGAVGMGKTVYLMTLVRDHLEAVPSLIVSREPYPSLEGVVQFDDPDLLHEARTKEGMTSSSATEAVAAVESRLDEMVAEGIRVVVYDDGPRQPLERLLRTARSRGLIILFTSYAVERGAEGNWVPREWLPEAAVTVMIDQRRERTVPTWVGIEQSWVRKAGRDAMPLLRPDDPYLPQSR